MFFWEDFIPLGDQLIQWLLQDSPGRLSADLRLANGAWVHCFVHGRSPGKDRCGGKQTLGPKTAKWPSAVGRFSTQILVPPMVVHSVQYTLARMNRTRLLFWSRLQPRPCSVANKSWRFWDSRQHALTQHRTIDVADQSRPSTVIRTPIRTLTNPGRYTCCFHQGYLMSSH